MVRVSQDDFLPDWVAHPGESLLEAMEYQGISQQNLARRTGLSEQLVNHIVRGKAYISPQTARKLEKALGISAAFWSGLDKEFQDWEARNSEQKALADKIGWLKNFNIKAMVDREYVQRYPDQLDQLEELLMFFGISHPDQWEQSWGKANFAFRKSQKKEASDFALKAWLRRGERMAAGIDCASYNRGQFQELIPELRNLTTTGPERFCPELQRRCAQVGVAVVFVPELPKTHVSGAARWLCKDKAMIQLSLRYKSEDMLWFTFFHECYHILHGAKKSIFLDDTTSSAPEMEEERKADRFAANILIPPKDYATLPKGMYELSKENICRFANQIGVSPGVVLGRLHHDGLVPFKNLNSLKRKLVWG